MNCQHTDTHEGPHIPRRYGSYRSIICDACEKWVMTDHLRNVPLSAWAPLPALEKLLDQLEDEE